MESEGIRIQGDPYETIVERLKEWIENRPELLFYDDYIVWVWTENLGLDTVILEFDGDGFVWQTDWYEGGECKLLGICPIGSLEIPEEWKLTEVTEG